MATAEHKQDDIVTIEVDGHALEAKKGEMIIQVTDRAGIDIPRFCYHHKLSIAANCRMCLVDVEKAPKPLPACATPVAEGMRVFTESRRAVDAQRGVMEFLLINHPLDCPICDQGGECELQDLSMGYGRSVSRFVERKRSVRDKNIGPLISTDMTRCIHCTRCIRFLQEIAGTSELGGIGRGEHMEISTFVERNVTSELSGNIIDLCPVGALTNKPFRFSARPWEMRARPSVASHDCLGSNLFYHVRSHKILRAVPRDHEAINECWLADRDRYSHFGLQSDDRLLTPRIKVNGQWREASWDEALGQAANVLRETVGQHGPQQLGALISPRATSEEHFLLQKLVRALGSENIDHRLRLNDFSHPLAGCAHMDIASRDLATRDAVFLIGSNPRQDQPILGHRLRSAWRLAGARIMDLNPVAYACHFDMTERLIVPPQAMCERLGGVLRAAFEQRGKPLPGAAMGDYLSNCRVDDQALAVAEQLINAERAAVLLGDGALSHAHGGWLRRLATLLTETVEGALCVLPGPGNSQGAWLAGTVPGRSGLDARAMLEQPRQGYVLWDLDSGLDLADPGLARRALRAAGRVVAVTAFSDPDLVELADVMLPLAPVPETDGSFVNLDSLTQTFEAAVRAPGQARPGWKILRRMGEMLALDGFDFVDLDPLRAVLEKSSIERTDETVDRPPDAPQGAIWRIGEVGLYDADSLVRRAAPLRRTRQATEQHLVRLHPATAESLGLAAGEKVCVRQGELSVEMEWSADPRIASSAVWLPAATEQSSGLGPSSGPISVEAGG